MANNQITPENKLQILLAAVEERYKSIHIMRDRVYKISIWTIGAFLVVVGWVAKAGSDFSCLSSAFITVAVVLSSGCVYLYIRDIEKGFKSNFKTLVKVEKLLGFYSSKFFDDAEESLYPKEWSKTKDRPGNFFIYSYLMLLVGAIILVGEVWLIHLFN